MPSDTLVDLIRLHEYLHLVFRIVAHLDRRHDARIKSPLDQKLRILRPLDDINILISKFTHYSHYTSALDTDAGSDRINTVIV